MRVKLIDNEKDLSQFQRRAQRYIGVLFPVDYIKESSVYGIYHNDQVMGGYLIKTDSQFRTIQGLPEEVQKRFLNSYKLNDICEITGLWIHPSLRKSAASWELIISIALKLVRRPKKYFVYTYSKKCAGLGKIYSLSKPKRIYEGTVKQLPGMKSTDEEIIEIASSIKGSLNVIKTYLLFSAQVLARDFLKPKISRISL